MQRAGDTAQTALTQLYIGRSYWASGNHKAAVPWLEAVARLSASRQHWHPTLRTALDLLIDHYHNQPLLQQRYLDARNASDHQLARDYPQLFDPKKATAGLEAKPQTSQAGAGYLWLLAAAVAGITGLFYVRRRWARLQARGIPVVGGAAIPSAGPTAQPVSYEADYLDSADVKQLFKISDKTLYRWRQKGSIPFTTIGGKIVYPKAAIMGQLQQRLDDKYDPIHLTERQKAD